MSKLLKHSDYKNWLIELKTTIQKSQIKAALTVNSELILLYWNLGKQIAEKQQNSKWGSGFINQLSVDLKAEFPKMGGFSKRNLENILQWFLFYNEDSPIAKQLVSQLENISTLSTENEQNGAKYRGLLFQIPWGHHVLIVQKIKEINQAFFYVEQTIQNNWSRAVLEMQIESGLYGRQGKAIHNFKSALPEIDSDLANALLKDPYNFEFLTLSKQVKEQDLELKLVENISRFLLELGKGFAYMGRQFLVTVGGKEFRTDLLFYHTKLKCYIVIELKVTEFEPEFLGKLNFYLTAINNFVKADDDKPTIGILLCKNKNNVVVDFALKDINKPMGVSEFRYTELSQELKEALPTLEQFTEQLNQE